MTLPGTGCYTDDCRIEVCQELGTSYDNVQFQVEMKYNLSQEEAERYMKQYWK